MAIRRACMQSLVLVVAMRAAGPALAQSAERPSVRPGDEWHFVVYHGTRSTVPNRVWRVVTASAQRIEATENGAPLTLTPDLNVLDSPLRRDTNTRQLQFPLSVGLRWGYVTDLQFKDNGSTATTTAEVQVQAYEKVRVAAGEFDAFRIAASGRIDGRSRGGPGVLAGEFVSVYWYAPSVRAIVKSTTTSTYRGTAHVELVEARLQP
jgi:hypothetical protein